MRRQIASIRLGPDQKPTDELLMKTYNATVSTASAEIVDLWASGIHPPPMPCGHIEVVKLADESKAIVGFAAYLVWDEPRRLGPMRVETT
jgi:hypothetical protein